MISNLFQEIKKRKIRKWLTIYISSVITLLGVTHLFSLRYELPDFIFNIVLFCCIVGIITATIIAWYHGEEGKQEINKVEYYLHASVLIIALIIGFFVLKPESFESPELTAHSIAVLPFQNLSDSEENEYFSDGVTEDILTQLSKIGDLKVVSRTSVMKYKDTKKSIRQIGKELGVENILEGSVRRYGDKVRITGQLINAVTDKHIWAETYDRKIDDIFLIQSEVAQKIADELKAKLSPAEKKLIESKPTENIEAYALYLKGRQNYYKYSENELLTAIEHFKKAIGLDPEFALAYAGLADTYGQLISKFWYSQNYVDSIFIMANKSVELNPDLAEGYKALGFGYEIKGELNKALDNYNKSISLNPNYWPAIFNSGGIHYVLGNLDKAIIYSHKAIELAPDNTYSYVLTGMCYESLGNIYKAENWFNKALELEPNNIFVMSQLGWHYLMLDDMQKASDYLNEIYKIKPDWALALDLEAAIDLFLKNYKQALEIYKKLYGGNQFSQSYHLAFVYAKLGDEEKAKSILSSYLKENTEKLNDNPASYSPYLDQGYVLTLLGRHVEAVKWFEKAFEKGYLDYRWMLADPMLESIRDKKEFQILVDKIKTEINRMNKNLENELKDENLSQELI